MTVRLRDRRRGSFMFGFAALTAILAVTCALVLARSLDAYRVSAVLEQRLQARAAAEGAAVAIARDPAAPRDAMEIGACLVSFGAPQVSDSASTVPLTVGVRPKGTRETMSRRFASVYARADGGWTLERLVPAP
jgi:hypothetical protein